MPTANPVRRRSGDTTTYAINFAYGDATPKSLFTATADAMVLSVTVVIEEAFNGTGPALTVGDSGDTDRLMQADQNDPASVGTYQSNPGYSYSTATGLTLSITPGDGATAGAGVVVIEIEAA